MKFLRKFDNYLLENHPILWHSKLPYLLMTGVVFWIGFFAAGFLSVDFETIKNKDSLRDHFADIGAIWFYMLLTLIVLSVWALYFFRKNAIRHFYPLSRFYLLRMFLGLIIGFLPLFTVYYPFDQAVRLKVRSLTDLADLQKDAKTLNFAMPFVGEHSYSLEYKSYPDPFPLDFYYQNRHDTNWSCTTDKDDLFLSPDDIALNPYNPALHPENTIKAEGVSYQFFRMRDTTRQTGPCDYNSRSYNLITKFVFPDTSLLRDRSIKNYDDVPFRGAFLPLDRYQADGPRIYYSYYRQEELDGYVYTHEFRDHYGPTLHRWMNDNKKDSIIDAVEDFKKVLDKHGLRHVIDSRMLVNYLSKSDYQPLFTRIVDQTMAGWTVPIKERRLKNFSGDFDPLYGVKNVPFYMGYEGGKLGRIYSNAKYGHFGKSQPLMLTTCCYFAVAFAFLFLLFEFTNFIHLIIAIPSTGALVIVTSLIYFLSDLFFRMHYRSETAFIMVLILTMTSLMLLLSYIGATRTAFKKGLSGVLLNIGYLVSAFYIPIVIVCMDILTEYEVVGKCGYADRRHTFWNDLLTPELILIFGTLGIVLYLGLIKKWYAREE